MLAGALLWKGGLLYELEECDEALAAFDQLVTRFGSATDPVVRQRVASGLATKTVILQRLGRSAEAVDAGNELARRCAAPVAPEVFSLVFHGLLYQGMAFEDLGRPDDAVQVYLSLLDRITKGESGAAEENVTYARYRLDQLRRAGQN